MLVVTCMVSRRQAAVTKARTHWARDSTYPLDEDEAARDIRKGNFQARALLLLIVVSVS